MFPGNHIHTIWTHVLYPPKYFHARCFILRWDSISFLLIASFVICSLKVWEVQRDGCDVWLMMKGGEHTICLSHFKGLIITHIIIMRTNKGMEFISPPHTFVHSRTKGALSPFIGFSSILCMQSFILIITITINFKINEQYNSI